MLGERRYLLNGRLGHSLASASNWDTSAVTISQGKGSGLLTNASPVDQADLDVSEEHPSVFPLSLLVLLFFLSIFLLVNISQMNRFWLPEIGS